MFVQAERFLAAHNLEGSDISVYGQELNERTWRMAKMNLAIHGLNANLASRWGDTFARDQHPELSGSTGADFVMANPPFNIKDWARSESDPRWKYGVPPAGNANYAWIQHIISKLAPDGTAGVVMANGSMSSNSGGEREIRARLVEADLISCMVALPTRLFRSTGIPVCTWFLAKDKTPGTHGSVNRTGEVLFIDARNLGYMVDRAERALADDDISRIANTFHAWRGTRSAVNSNLIYENEPGFCYSASVAEIQAAGYALTPSRYVEVAVEDDDGEPAEEKIARLSKELQQQFNESEKLAALVRTQLGRIL